MKVIHISTAINLLSIVNTHEYVFVHRSVIHVFYLICSRLLDDLLQRLVIVILSTLFTLSI